MEEFRGEMVNAPCSRNSVTFLQAHRYLCADQHDVFLAKVEDVWPSVQLVS